MLKYIIGFKFVFRGYVLKIAFSKRIEKYYKNEYSGGKSRWESSGVLPYLPQSVAYLGFYLDVFIRESLTTGRLRPLNPSTRVSLTVIIYLVVSFYYTIISTTAPPPPPLHPPKKIPCVLLHL